jgi:hypothetical protein
MLDDDPAAIVPAGIAIPSAAMLAVLSAVAVLEVVVEGLLVVVVGFAFWALVVDGADEVGWGDDDGLGVSLGGCCDVAGAFGGGGGGGAGAPPPSL